MANCNQSINNIINNNLDVDTLKLDERFTINFDNPQLFKMLVNSYSNISFRLISDNDPRTTLFIYDESGDIVSNSQINTNVITLTSNFKRGVYYLCFSTNSFIDVTFNMKTTITPHEEPINMYVEASYGAFNNYVFKVRPRPPIDLDLPVEMEIIDGKLPDGLIMNGKGEISGRVAEMDCSDDTLDNSPSFDFYNEHDSTETMSWGKVWRFKVKAWLAFSPDTKPIEQWFCIKVFNNWSNDRDDFLEMINLMDDIIESKYVYKTIDDIKLPEGLCITRCETAEEIISPPIIGIELESNCPIDEENIDVIVDMRIDKVIVPPSAFEYVMNGYNDEKLLNNYLKFKIYLLNTPNLNIDCDNFIINIRSSMVLNTMVEFQQKTSIRQSDTKKDYLINFNEESNILEFAEFDKVPTFKKQDLVFSPYDPLGTLDYKTMADQWNKSRENNIRKNSLHVHARYGSFTSIQLR